MRTLLENIESRIDPDDELSGPDIGEAILVVYQAIKAGHQGKRGVPTDVVADRAYGYIRDMRLVSQAMEDLVERGKVLRGQDGELYVS